MEMDGFEVLGYCLAAFGAAALYVGNSITYEMYTAAIHDTPAETKQEAVANLELLCAREFSGVMRVMSPFWRPGLKLALRSVKSQYAIDQVSSRSRSA